MAKISLVLADSDSFFANKFSRYILEHNNFFDVVSFTAQQYFLDYIKNNKPQILLIDEEFIIDDIKPYIQQSLTIVLSDSGNGSADQNGYYHINKYQKTENIVKDITFMYAESVGDQSILAGNTLSAQIITVYSPSGGSGKTTISLAIACMLAQMGHKVMYFSMERFSSASRYIDMSGGDGLSEIFLRLKNKAPNLSFEIMKRLLTDSSGVHYFSAPESAMEYNEMSNEEIATLIKECANITDMEYLIVDLPSEFNDDVINIFKMSGKVLFVSGSNTMELAKTSHFMKEMDIFADLRIVYEKFIPVLNKSLIGGIPQQMQQVFGDKNITASVPLLNNIDSCNTALDIARMMDNYLVDVIRSFTGR